MLIFFGWLEARIGNARNALSLAEKIDSEADRTALLVFTAGGQLAAGDRERARRAIETLLGRLDPESQVWSDANLLGFAAYAQALAGDATGVYGWAAAREDIEARALVLGLTAAGDVEATFEAARRARNELHCRGRTPRRGMRRIARRAPGSILNGPSWPPTAIASPKHDRPCGR